ncbi:Mitochondrial-processing peptidase subunit alpha [Kappamyces sp. JEL0680]|nr:Mitochondrial-processing peptidase subunit alpha [Kappamyces sp. JEL0680]
MIRSSLPAKRLFSTSQPVRSRDISFPHHKDSIITTLPNGVRVASQPHHGHFVSAGVLVNAGSRYENDITAGASHLLDKLTFKSTQKYTSMDLVQKIENMGGQFQCVASRETIMYQASVFPKDIEPLMDVFGQIVCHPLLKPEELEEAKVAAGYEIYDTQWDTLLTLPEKLHAVAYRDPAKVAVRACPG